MNKHFRLIDSFKCAFKGVFFVICHERNMRIHIVAALYVAFFSVFYDFSKSEIAVLVITCGLVMVLEAVNTAIEIIVDKVSPKYSPLARLAKDTASGAVLISAITAVIVGIVMFFDMERFKIILAFFSEWSNLLIFLSFTLIGVVFITSGKKRKIKGKTNND
ncbi:MAG: diacylglycerol kinase family protein [Firmicutes bacterium]|nr:diacylglycerol kinase family protein [[Eubacterium] siraeum]MCM1487083.1 diacylglycerol kinase family protein [Bacillota bacterium]